MRKRIKLTKSGRKAIIAPFVWLLISAITFFAVSGRLNILRAWLYFIIAFTITLGNSIYIYIALPGLANERGEFKPDSKGKDKLFLLLFILIPTLLIPAVAALEVGRYNISLINQSVTYTAILLYLIAHGINMWAMNTNKHFEGTIRIQQDREHKVIKSGPYRFIRHPGYLSMILGVLVVPLILGSLFAMIPALLTCGVIVLRTSFEDTTLQNELEGYKEYSNETKYKIIPGIW